MDTIKFRKTVPAVERIEQAAKCAIDHINRGIPINSLQRNHARQWTIETAHAVFELHPELREENSLPRYFIAKAGRKKGIFGAALTEFVEAEYQAGTWYKHVPEEVLKQSI